MTRVIVTIKEKNKNDVSLKVLIDESEDVSDKEADVASMVLLYLNKLTIIMQEEYERQKLPWWKRVFN